MKLSTLVTLLAAYPDQEVPVYLNELQVRRTMYLDRLVEVVPSMVQLTGVTDHGPSSMNGDHYIEAEHAGQAAIVLGILSRDLT